MAGVITASEPSWIAPFTGLSAGLFRKLVTALRREGADAVRKGRPWSLPLEDRALLVAAYWRTNLTMRQLALLFGVSKSAADRSIDQLGPMLALQPHKRFAKDTMLIVDGTLVPTHPRSHCRRAVEELPVLHKPPGRHRRRHPPRRDRRPAPARQPQRLRGVGRVRREGRRRHDDDDRRRRLSGYRARDATSGRQGEELPGRKQAHNKSHKQVRARVKHVFARMKTWKILRDCRLKGDGVHHAMLGIARMYDLALAG
ncbi:transposase family protein [Streptomyces sp. NPDC092295]|uniref:transposase family protein n=1 Tax=Streptomyces sp. NPDC092295 TaxID=3366011 RepID=UPI0037F5421A